MKSKGKYSRSSSFFTLTSPNQAKYSMVKLQLLQGLIRVPKTPKKVPKAARMRSIYRGLEIRVFGLKIILGA